MNLLQTWKTNFVARLFIFLTCFSSANLRSLESISRRISSQASHICWMVESTYWNMQQQPCSARLTFIRGAGIWGAEVSLAPSHLSEYGEGVRKSGKMISIEREECFLRIYWGRVTPPTDLFISPPLTIMSWFCQDFPQLFLRLLRSKEDVFLLKQNGHHPDSEETQQKWQKI